MKNQIAIEHEQNIYYFRQLVLITFFSLVQLKLIIYKSDYRIAAKFMNTKSCRVLPPLIYYCIKINLPA